MSVAATRIIVTILITVAVMFAAARATYSATATADDTARFLAGLQPSPNSSLAALTKEQAQMKGKRVGVILTGGNIDGAKFAQVLQGRTPLP